jgi:hypothetical protein
MSQNTYEDESGLAAGVYEDVYLIVFAFSFATPKDICSEY